MTLEALAREPSSPPGKDEEPAGMETILFDPVTSVRRALFLALGAYQDLPPRVRGPLAATLLETYRNDPDAGVHGAVEWTLRQWQQQGKLETVDLPTVEDRGRRRWFKNGAGQTLAVIVGPVDFLMGSPPTEPSRDSGETRHRQRIDQPFAVATKEVTREQYQRFVQAHPRNQPYDPGDVTNYSPDPQGPQVRVSWYDAAAYCNWLSEQEHLEPCYGPNDQGAYADGMKLTPDALMRSGYRLPTEAEWEYVCRAGAVTSRYYGGAMELLGDYAWYAENSPSSQTAACARLKPNDLGLFDLLGNVGEWCQDQVEGDDNPTSLLITENHLRLLRGGSYTRPAALVRSAFRGGIRPSGRNLNNGFRPARTLGQGKGPARR
jgi:formylglycine-generating enzyme required for sulfatase activity